MLNENIKTLRKAKGLSQEELATKLNVVRQTVSKWENGLSVPDSELLIALAEVFEVPVSTLLGEKVDKPQADDLRAISEKLEIINLQLARKNEAKRTMIRVILAVMAIVTVLVLLIIAKYDNIWNGWDFNDPETAVAGTFVHAFVWIFVRISPFILIGSILGIILSFRKK